MVSFMTLWHIITVHQHTSLTWLVNECYTSDHTSNSTLSNTPTANLISTWQCPRSQSVKSDPFDCQHFCSCLHRHTWLTTQEMLKLIWHDYITVWPDIQQPITGLAGYEVFWQSLVPSRELKLDRPWCLSWSVSEWSLLSRGRSVVHSRELEGHVQSALPRCVEHLPAHCLPCGIACSTTCNVYHSQHSGELQNQFICSSTWDKKPSCH